MDATQARLWLVRTSLLATAALIGFVIIAPLLHCPGMGFQEAIRLGELIFPVFFGYLGSATAFLLAPGKDFHVSSRLNALFVLLIKGPVIIFIVGSGLAIVAFGVTNRGDAAPGSGMTIDTLSGFITVFLGLLTITTNSLAARLFATEHKPKEA